MSLLGRSVKVDEDVSTEDVLIKEKADAYIGTRNNELHEEFQAAKKAYKLAKQRASTKAERQHVMEAFMDDCIDIAVEARATDDWEFKRQMDGFIDSLAKRTYTPKRSRY